VLHARTGNATALAAKLMSNMRPAQYALYVLIVTS
jgi:hypothetical protein